MGPNGSGYDTTRRRRILAPALEQDLRCAAMARVPVLITAERGTAAWLAWLIHEMGRQHAGRFRILDAAAAGPSAPFELRRLLDAADADGSPGTLFLPEIERASPAFRAELGDRLTAVPMPEHWPALIASSSVALEKRVEEGLFDDRLFYRLNSIHIRLSVDRPERYVSEARADVSGASSGPQPGGSLSRHASKRLEQTPGDRSWLAISNGAVV